jgi:HEAT repeat protein
MAFRASSRRSEARSAVLIALAIAALPTPAAVAQGIPLDTGSARAGARDKYGKPQATQKLDDNVRKLNGDDPEERLEAIKGLGELADGEKKAVDYLLQAANDPEPRIRLKAIDTLGSVKAKDATPLLVQQLFLRGTDLKTKQHILAALGKIGDARATRPIVDFLARDVDPAVRGNAIFALGDIGDRAALPPLEALAENQQDTVLRPLAQEAVRKIRERPPPPVIPPALKVDRRGPGEEPQTP